MGKVWARTDNFWSEKRVESGIDLKELGAYLGLHRTSVSHFFSGQAVPSDPIIMKICDFFDVKYDKGIEEFRKIRQDWEARHDKTVKTAKRIENSKTAKVVQATPDETPSVSVNLDNTEDSVMRYLYGKIAYDDFKAIMKGNAPETDILKMLYGKVDYPMYAKIASIIVNIDK